MELDAVKQYADLFGNIAHKREFLKSQKQELINQIIPPEIQAALEELDFEFAEKEKALDDEEKNYRKILDRALEEYLASVPITDKGLKIKSDLVTVHVSKGDIVWNPVALDAYALTHPEILSFRDEKPAKTRVLKNKM